MGEIFLNSKSYTVAGNRITDIDGREKLSLKATSKKGDKPSYDIECRRMASRESTCKLALKMPETARHTFEIHYTVGEHQEERPGTSSKSNITRKIELTSGWDTKSSFVEGKKPYTSPLQNKKEAHNVATFALFAVQNATTPEFCKDQKEKCKSAIEFAQDMRWEVLRAIQGKEHLQQRNLEIEAEMLPKHLKD